MIRYLSIACIKLYQKFISPKKGYRCAHSVLHGGTGCSGAVIQIINENSIFSWRKLIKQRFSDCKSASKELKEKKKNKNCLKKCDISDACDSCDACDVDMCDLGSL